MWVESAVFLSTKLKQLINSLATGYFCFNIIDIFVHPPNCQSLTIVPFLSKFLQTLTFSISFHLISFHGFKQRLLEIAPTYPNKCIPYQIYYSHLLEHNPAVSLSIIITKSLQIALHSPKLFLANWSLVP